MLHDIIFNSRSIALLEFVILTSHLASYVRDVTVGSTGTFKVAFILTAVGSVMFTDVRGNRLRNHFQFALTIV